MLELPAHTCDIQLCLCSQAGLEVFQIIHEYCVPTGSSVLYAHVNSCFGKRHRSLGRRVFLWPFLSTKSPRGDQGSQSQVPRYTKAGDPGACGEQDARRAGVKHFGLQDVRQVRQRCLKKTPGRRIYSEIWDSLISRQADLPAGWVSLLCCAKFKQHLALPGPVGPHPCGSCWASTQAMGEHWGLSSAPQKLMYTEYRDFFSTSSTVHLSYGNSKW